MPGMRVPKHGGGRLKTGGTPGNKGGTGRPPDAWKALCRELASSDAMMERAKAVLNVPNHPAWLGAWKFLTEQGYGKPAQPVEHDGTLTVRVTFE